MSTPRQGPETPPKAKVLVIDDDRDITELVYAILTDEGFAVAVLNSVNGDAIRVAVNQLEPDCILLDGADVGAYGLSWDHAAWVQGRDRRVPLIMFSGHAAAVQEAESGEYRYVARPLALRAYFPSRSISISSSFR